MKRAVALAVVTSIVMAIVVPFAIYLFFDQRAMLKPGVEYPKDYFSWSVTAQNDWGLANTRIVGGTELLAKRLKYPESFLTEFAVSAGSAFLVSFAACLVYAFLNRPRPNPAVNTDAPPAGLRPRGGPPVT